MIEKDSLIEFIKPYYENKDIMHNMWHVELVERQMNKIIDTGRYSVNYDFLYLALAFHGLIYSDEQKIRDWLNEKGYTNEEINQIVKISWESQRPQIPETIEGKILHDAHVLEGGKNYTVVKTLITGSVRGQSLLQTLEYMRSNVPGKNKCYLPETIPLCDEMNSFTEKFFNELTKGIN